LKKKKKLNKKEIKFDIEEIKIFIEKFKNSKIYLGCDSQVTRKRVRYATVICIHYEGSRGAKVFGEVTYDHIIDANKSKPINRMLSEVNKIVELYNKLEEVLIDRIDDIEIHVDVNPNENEGSYVAYGAAKGMIQSMIGIMPIFKPFAFASSCTADKLCR